LFSVFFNKIVIEVLAGDKSWKDKNFFDRYHYKKNAFCGKIIQIIKGVTKW